MTEAHPAGVEPSFKSNTDSSDDLSGRCRFQHHALHRVVDVSHGYSFMANYLGKGEYRTATTQDLMSAPYGRVMALHLAILGGGFVLMSLGEPVWGLILLIVLKTGMDIRAHRKEHEKAAKRAASG